MQRKLQIPIPYLRQLLTHRGDVADSAAGQATLYQIEAWLTQEDVQCFARIRREMDKDLQYVRSEPAPPASRKSGGNEQIAIVN